MFQVPWLPEFIIGLNDYRNFNAIFRGQKAVSHRTEFLPHSVYSLILSFSFSLSSSLPLSLPLSTGSEKQSIIPTRCSGGLQVHLLQTRSSHWTHQLHTCHLQHSPFHIFESKEDDQRPNSSSVGKCIITSTFCQ